MMAYFWFYGKFDGRGICTCYNMYPTSIYIGTWNVWSLYRPGSVKMLMDQVTHVKRSIIALQEIKWIAVECYRNEKPTRSTSAVKQRHELCTELTVAHKLKHLIIKHSLISLSKAIST